ncbi:MAG: hypothetical protein ACK44W_10915, partial [Planctomycetota bacterium]
MSDERVVPCGGLTADAGKKGAVPLHLWGKDTNVTLKVSDISKAMEEGDKRAELAFKMETYRLRKYIGSYIAAMGQKPD